MSELWLAIELPHLGLDLHTRGQELQRDLPQAISDGNHQRQQIRDCNPAAERLGIQRGMPINAALGLVTGLRLYPRDRTAEASALERLAAWSYQYSSHVSIGSEGNMLLLEIGGSERLFGEATTLSTRLTRELLELGYHARSGAGTNPEAARLAARRGLNLTTRAQLQQALKNLPLDALLLTDRQRKTLDKMGFRQTAEILRLPRKSLARRLGTDFVDHLDRLTGVQPDPQRYWRMPQSFSSSLDLSHEVIHTQGLLFPLRRLVAELCGALRAVDCGAQSLNINLYLRAGKEKITLGLQQPCRDEGHFMLLLSERLERLRLDTPAVRLQLQADKFLPFDAAAEGLFIDADNPASNPVGPLLERLRARLGDRSVAGLRGVEDHRPEHSWALRELDEPAPCKSMPHRPVWLFKKPRRCHIDDYRVLAGPERIEGGWWDGHDCRRDYFVVRDRQGATLWAYREYKPSPGWYLQGLFS